MTQTHISFGSIDQFRNCVKIVRDRAAHKGVPVPILDFHGTVKLHGTNASVVFPIDAVDSRELYAQSRSTVITPEDDNAGFARFVSERTGAFYDILSTIISIGSSKMPKEIVLFGEWCGGNIQSGVALNKLPKMFVMFGVRYVYEGEAEHGQTWFTPTQLAQVEHNGDNIKNIMDFPTFNITIDFEQPEVAQNKLVELTMAVEAECPVSKMLGVSGIGEGIVWTCEGVHLDIGDEDAIVAMNEMDAKHPGWNDFYVNDLGFKTKGEKHSDTKTKTIVPIDVEKVNSVRALVDAVCTEHRLEKMYDKLREQGFDVLDVKNTGEFLKLVAKDVEKEELDMVTESGLVWKDVVGELSKSARKYWMGRLDKGILA